ncbi:uncharacterized protein LOC111711886, partial [Eurytemora carolleeae]|uniref:uncharacterized protein LOC111711886 n=1 Tax=Eurytemora carolleeae TaxID=1294199 RepID=UPI000C769EB0
YYVAGFGGSFTLVCDSSKLLEKLSEQSEENQLTQSEQSQLTQSERSQLTQSERNQQIKVEKRQLKFAEEVSQEELVEKKELKRKLLKKKKAEDNFEETERNVVISWDSDADIFSTKSRKDPEFEEYIEENRLIVHMYNITDQHVGNYFCNFTTQGEETQTTSQYVFVNGSTKMVVQDEYIRFFKYLERTDLNIPCRPTSPTIEVSLTLFSSPHEKITGLEFDPRVGFKSKNVSAGYHIYRCFYNSKGLREQSQLVNIQVLHIPPDRRGVAAPLVTAWNLTDGVQLQLLNKTLHVQEGNHVRLSCNATLESSNDLKLIWKKQKKVAEDQLEINKSSNYVTRDLVLENITEFDSATYSCFVLNPVGENNSYTINIEVKAEKPEYCLLRHVATSEKNVQEETLNGYSDEKSLTGGIKPSLNYKEYNQQNPSVDDCARIPAKVGERVNLSMIQTRSSVFYQLKWFNPSGEEQDCENSRSKLKYGCSRTTDNIDNIVVYIKKVFVVYIHLHLLSTLRRYVLSISRRYLLCTTRRYLLSTSSCICCLH